MKRNLSSFAEEIANESTSETDKDKDKQDDCTEPDKSSSTDNKKSEE